MGGGNGKICPFDNSSSGPIGLRFDCCGPWHRVANPTHAPLYDPGRYRRGNRGVRAAAAAHGIHGFMGLLLVQM